MTRWIAEYLGLSMDEVSLLIALASLILSVLVVTVAPLRRAAGRLLFLSAATLGYSERRYRRWYDGKYRRVYNIYLNMYDTLDLHDTYIGLSVIGEAGIEERIPAALVLGDRSTRRLVITGDPGSGKSTLAKAYGVGILRTRQDRSTSDLRLIDQGRDREVPFYVPLRKLALAMPVEAQPARVADPVFDYIVQEILVVGAGLSERAAKTFLRGLLKRRRCLVFLDGLDEVPADKLRKVRAAVADFDRGRLVGLQTDQARLVLTCRPQNFLAVRAEWVPSFARHVHSLSPLRDDEIQRYARSLRDAFPAPKIADSYLSEIRLSGTLEYHRTPLVLAISTGLYVGQPDYQIPRSVPLLYEAMVNDLLQRHDFPVEPIGFAHQFSVKDKYRMLSEYALHTARERGFGDFTRRELVAFGRRVAITMSDVRPRQVDDLVDEITRMSGLITEVSDGELAIAHRSIHEYLVAVRLAADPEGHVEVAGNAADPEWRQVILLYSSLEQADVDPLLTALAESHLELAGHCLSGARPSVELAQRIISALSDRFHHDDDAHVYLTSLLSSGRSPIPAIREAATRAVRSALSGSADRNQLLGRLAADQLGLLRIIEGLADSSTAETIALVPPLAALLPGEPNLVGPLWTCLRESTPAPKPVLAEIAGQMLTLAMSPACFSTLQGLPSQSATWMTAEARRRIYPFKKGHPIGSNIVTLLCWAAALHVKAPRINRFLRAAYSNPVAFARIERDRARTLAVSLYRPMLVFNVAACVGLVGAAITVVIMDPHTVLEPYGWRSLLVFFAPLPIAFAAHALIYDGILRSEPRDDAPSLFQRIGPVGGIPLTVVTLAVSILFAPLLDNGAWKFLLCAPAAVYVLRYLPEAALFAEERTLYVFQANVFVDVFDDPDSAHWVLPGMLDPAKRRLLDVRYARQRGLAPSSATLRAAKRETGPHRRSGTSDDITPDTLSWSLPAGVE